MDAQVETRFRIIVADDHTGPREWICQVLNHTEGFEIIYAAQDGEDALWAIRKYNPELAVLDIAMPKKSGVAVIRELRKLGLKTKIVIVTGHGQNKAYLNECWKLGVEAYLLKSEGEQRVRQVVSAVAWGGRGYLTEGLVPSEPHATIEEKFSPLERRILRYLAEGLTSQEIEERVDRRIKNVLSDIYNKMGLEGSDRDKKPKAMIWLWRNGYMPEDLRKYFGI